MRVFVLDIVIRLNHNDILLLLLGISLVKAEIILNRSFVRATIAKSTNRASQAASATHRASRLPKRWYDVNSLRLIPHTPLLLNLVHNSPEPYLWRWLWRVVLPVGLNH